MKGSLPDNFTLQDMFITKWSSQEERFITSWDLWILQHWKTHYTNRASQSLSTSQTLPSVICSCVSYYKLRRLSYLAVNKGDWIKPQGCIHTHTYTHTVLFQRVMNSWFCTFHNYYKISHTQWFTNMFDRQFWSFKLILTLIWTWLLSRQSL